ncbi:hypothetical protein [Flavobacterium sp. 102]|uniref:hypothetical protein n=1 Tax=Flavobacterium sp. 102 TaxID=2135623 RepID=UPI000EB21EA5|nr:hypothetical protein [Flavobacterium sp. 102]RKS00405.1 hypothetical protein C8C84_0013 [Flavobacterium sp. 102]RKS03731.1 hypothetical protein C8C84_3497 [Flavobacterium sp. 102]
MNFIKDLYFSLIFLADNTYNKKPFLIEKLIAFGKLIVTFGPIAFVLDTINIWFLNNHEFVSGFIVAVIFNAVFGLAKHNKLKTHSWGEFMKETSLMLTCVIAIYILLSVLNNFAGDSVVSEVFQIMIQVSTLFYPISKCIKSIHILSNGEYPSEFIMKKFYNFKKDGDVQEFFKTGRESSDFIEQREEDNPT